jgi:Fic/DOC family
MPLDHPLPIFLFAGGDAANRRRIAALKKQGLIRAAGPRLYTSLPDSRVAEVIRTTWTQVVPALFPDALLSHRTAFEFKPSPKNEIFLTANTNRTVEYPGLSLHFLRGPKPLDDDPAFLGMRSSSLARMFLENLSRSRVASTDSRVSAEEIDRRLDLLLRNEGEERLNQLRDRAREISALFGWSAAFKRLDGIIGTLLGTRRSALAGPIGRARAAGVPFDPSCFGRLQALFSELHTRSFVSLVDPFESNEHFRNKAFFESYFSNYIEGTIFPVEEAEAIAFENKIPTSRPQEAHDIAGTFRLVSDLGEMKRTPADFSSFAQLLQSRHATMMAGRPEILPGRFKDQRNRAGDTHFVEPELVEGTLRKGFELYETLRRGMPRAIFTMFLISDVHPFTDGNGRACRIMMNAELLASGLATVIIPNVFRDDYIQALRALTRRGRSEPLIDVITMAQRFCVLDFTSYPKILRELERRNWFKESDDARVVQ